jgi:hypothetical protein
MTGRSPGDPERGKAPDETAGADPGSDLAMGRLRDYSWVHRSFNGSRDVDAAGPLFAFALSA